MYFLLERIIELESLASELDVADRERAGARKMKNLLSAYSAERKTWDDERELFFSEMQDDEFVKSLDERVDACDRTMRRIANKIGDVANGFDKKLLAEAGRLREDVLRAAEAVPMTRESGDEERFSGSLTGLRDAWRMVESSTRELEEISRYDAGARAAVEKNNDMLMEIWKRIDGGTYPDDFRFIVAHEDQFGAET